MDQHPFGQTFRPTLVVLILVTSIGLSGCLLGVDWVDEVIFPEDFAADQPQGMQAEPDLGAQLLLPSEPQGEFVAPVAPVAPQGQPIAPQANPPQPAVSGTPVILSTYFPSPIPADGQWHYGWIDFTDSYGDVKTLKIEIMWTTAPVKGPGATRDAEIEGAPTAGKVRMRFT